ncbi:PLP-dependent aminotransferase family protein [Ktedonosporobacter rubrisoli]|uniref:PLP-dependent aminotransferase family protein n=1 Tax=Ktedonosporobacter rubrisoli TaxID=2509675 RepID=A0A4P6JN64_KTERU|nr:PLP-dependent aminotransferase family protein [Ktedonosporobacter rubrisoli]QBD76704.1 PLP-dependent aminotransferase family protein [Ktedonosporobacter rubrisoli]
MDYRCFALQKDASTPLYRQLADHIKRAVKEGELQPGEKLPPIRKLAEQLGISPITVSQSYDVLALEGVASGSIGRGTFLLPRPSITSAFQAKPLQPTLEGSQQPPAKPPEWMAALQQQLRLPRAALLQRTLQNAVKRWPAEEPLLHFSSGNPDANLFSLERWQEAMTQAGISLKQEEDTNNLQYGASALGDPALRSFLAAYIRRYGIYVDTESILLTSGTQQGLDLIARSLLQPGDSVFVEEMSYISALDIFEQRGVQWETIPLDEYGLQTEVLARKLEATPQNRPRLLYTIPTGQSPTGVSLAQERRRHLAELARKHNLLIIEDDAFNELYYQGVTPAPAIWNYETEGRVIYLKSFSKTIFPAVRLGCIVAAPALLSVLVRQKQIFDRPTPISTTRTVLHYLNALAYERELTHIRRTYHQRRNALLTALEQELSPFGCHWSIPQAGFNLLLSIPEHLDSIQVVEEAASRGLVLAPGQFFAPVRTQQSSNTLRLTFADKSPQQLEEATRRLAAVLQTLVQTERRPIHSTPQFTTEV